MRMDFWGWAQVRSFYCDMYWPLFGFGLGGSLIFGGGFNKRKKGLSLMHSRVRGVVAKPLIFSWLQLAAICP